MSGPRHSPAPEQVELFTLQPNRTPDELLDALSTVSGRPLHLTLTRNRSHMVSVAARGPEDPVKVRLHQSFLQAPDHVVQSLAKYVKRSRRADWRVVSDFAQSIQPDRTVNRRAPRLPTRGRAYDLRALSEEVNRRFFRGRLGCRVGWAPARHRGPRARRRVSIRYGSYHRDTDTIRIHRLLDDPRVPQAFLEYIIYHEMLHAVVPPERRNGRWMYHPPAFRHLERRFPDWPRMQALARELLDRLD